MVGTSEREPHLALVRDYVEKRETSLDALAALAAGAGRELAIDLLNESYDQARAILGLPAILRAPRPERRV